MFFKKNVIIISVTNNPNNSYDNWGFSLAKWIIREQHCVCRALSSPSRLPPGK